MLHDDASSRVEVHIRIRPPLEYLGELFDAPAVRSTLDTTVIVQPRTRYGHPPQTAAASRPPSSSSTLHKQGHRSATPPPPRLSETLRCRNSTALNTQQTFQEEQTFVFDRVFDGTSTQSDVYDESVLELVDHALDGGNVSILAYGPTGSGKTHTMVGDWSSSSVRAPQECADLGVLPRVVLSVLHYVRHSNPVTATAAPFSDKPHVHSRLKGVTLFAAELYLDEVRDLLVVGPAAAGGPLPPLRDNGGLQELCAMLTPVPLSSVEALFAAYDAVSRNRVTVSHRRNDKSSRSHAVFLLRLEFDLTWKIGHAPNDCAFIALVDLAGSERVKQSNVDGVGMLEAQSINKSLSSLCSVIYALHNGSKHVPYRDSKLTRLLRPCFESGRVLALVHVPPGPETAEEACTTLKFAERMKEVKLLHTAASGKNQQKLGYEDIHRLEQQRTEELMLQSERALRELAADLRVAGALHGYVVRRIARQPAHVLMRDARFRAAQSLRNQEREDSEAGARLCRSLIDSAMIPSMSQLTAMKGALEEMTRRTDLLHAECTMPTPTAATSAVDGVTKSHFDGECDAATKSVKRSLRQQTAAKESIVALRDRLRIVALAEQEIDELWASLNEQTAAVKAPVREEQRALDVEMGRLREEVRKTRDMQTAFERVVALTCQIASLVEVRTRNAQLKREARRAVLEDMPSPSFIFANQTDDTASTILVPSFRPPLSSSKWRRPLQLSNGKPFTPKPTLFGCYDDAHALFHASVQQLIHGVECAATKRVTGAGSSDGETFALPASPPRCPPSNNTRPSQRASLPSTYCTIRLSNANRRVLTFETSVLRPSATASGSNEHKDNDEDEVTVANKFTDTVDLLDTSVAFSLQIASSPTRSELVFVMRHNVSTASSQTSPLLQLSLTFFEAESLEAFAFALQRLVLTTPTATTSRLEVSIGAPPASAAALTAVKRMCERIAKTPLLRSAAVKECVSINDCRCLYNAPSPRALSVFLLAQQWSQLKSELARLYGDGEVTLLPLPAHLASFA